MSRLSDWINADCLCGACMTGAACEVAQATSELCGWLPDHDAEIALKAKREQMERDCTVLHVGVPYGSYVVSGVDRILGAWAKDHPKEKQNGM